MQVEVKGHLKCISVKVLPGEVGCHGDNAKIPVVLL